MRIAYIANFQGPGLIADRRIRRNAAFAGSQKIRTIAEVLESLGHDVVIFSAGAPAERTCRYYPPRSETIPGCSRGIVEYPAAIDFPVLSDVVAAHGLRTLIKREAEKHKFDLIVVYNSWFPEVLAAKAIFRTCGIPLLLEYEDGVSRDGSGRRTWKGRVMERGLAWLAPNINGLIGVSPGLLAQVNCPHKLLLRGVLGHDLEVLRTQGTAKAGAIRRVLYTGSISQAKGVNALCRAWVAAEIANCELHVVGDGAALPDLRRTFGTRAVFHGRVPRGTLIDLMATATVFVNPHRSAEVVRGSIFPFKVIEYLGAGCPVISTPLGEVEQEIADGISLCEQDTSESIAQALKEVFSQLDQCQKRVRKAQDYVWKEYSVQAVTRKIQALLREVL